MNKKEEFKKFVSSKPELINFIKDGSMSWQKFYEIYDLYGEDNKVWDSYLRKDNNSSFKINDILKNTNIDEIKKHIEDAQKALDFISELTNKGSSPVNNISVEPRPLNKFFED